MRLEPACEASVEKFPCRKLKKVKLKKVAQKITCLDYFLGWFKVFHSCFLINTYPSVRSYCPGLPSKVNACSSMCSKLTFFMNYLLYFFYSLIDFGAVNSHAAFLQPLPVHVHFSDDWMTFLSAVLLVSTVTTLSQCVLK